MVEIKVEISELKSEGDETIRELADFIKEKTSADVETTTGEIVVKSDNRSISRTYLRVVIRKFLHSVGLREYFKVLGCKGDTFVIKGKKIAEDEE